VIWEGTSLVGGGNGAPVPASANEAMVETIAAGARAAAATIAIERGVAL